MSASPKKARTSVQSAGGTTDYSPERSEAKLRVELPKIPNPREGVTEVAGAKQWSHLPEHSPFPSVAAATFCFFGMVYPEFR
jgi:hypothetical protein